MSKIAAWVLGLLGLALLTSLCVWTHAPVIERDLQARTTSALDAEGFPTAAVSLSGRDVTLTGTVPTEAARTQALTGAAAVEGVRVVYDRLVVGGAGGAPAGASSPFALIAGLNNILVVRGTVPDDASRQVLIERVRDAFPDRTVQDEMEIAAGMAGWQPSVDAILPSLGLIRDPGLSVEPGGDGGVVVLRGRVPSEGVRAEVEAAAVAAVRSPYTVRSELVVDTNDDAAMDVDAADTGGAGSDQVEASGSTDASVQAAEAALREVFAVGGVEFETATADLTSRSRGLLDRAASVFEQFPEVRAQVQGHTDSEDSSEHNQRLSQRRAEAVRAYLTGQGIAPDRLTARGYGEDQPVASNDTAEGRARNRRVVFRLER